MTTSSPPISGNGDEPTQPYGFRLARLALLFVAMVSLAGAVFRAYQAVSVVRGELVLDFVWRFVVYPAALAALAVLSILWLRRERAAGAVLASLLLTVHGLRTLLDAAAGEGYPNGTSRLAGQLFEGLFGVILIAGALSFAIAARVFHRRRTTATAQA